MEHDYLRTLFQRGTQVRVFVSNGFQLKGRIDDIGENGIIRQHGQMNFTLAATCRDTDMIERASFYAKRTAEADPELKEETNRRAAKQLERFVKEFGNTQN